MKKYRLISVKHWLKSVKHRLARSVKHQLISVYIFMREVLNMYEYGSRCLSYSWISLNMPDHGRILPNVPKYAWKCLNKLFYARVLNMSHYLLYLTAFWIYVRLWHSCDKIIVIVTNVIYIRILFCSKCTSRSSANNHFIFL